SQKSLHEPFVPVRDSDTFLPVVTQENDLRIDVMVQVLQVLPGEKETAEVRVTNLCNREMIEVHLDGSDLPDGWKVDLPEGNLKVFMGQTRSFMMEIRAPEDAVAFQKVMFTLSGYIIDQTNIRSTNTIPFSVLQFHEIEAGLKDTSTRSVSPGQIIPVQIEVVNLGNGEEIVNMGYDSEGNSIILSFQDRLNRSMDQFKMDGLETTEITAHVKIPADQATGLTRIIIEVHGQEQDIYLILDLQVSLASSVDIFGPTGEREIKIGTAPNKPGEVLVALTNEGNGPDDVNVEISGFHGAPVEKVIALGIICVQGCKEQSGEKTFWDFSNELDLTGGAHIKDIVPTGSMPVLNGRHKRSGLLSIDLRLERSMQVFIRIAFCIDPLASDDTIESPSFMVTASAGDSISELPILIDLKYPALGFQGDIEMVGNSKVDGYDASHGDRITFLVKVVNLGSIYASDVVVQLAVDGRKVSNVTLPRVGIGSGEEKVVMLTWEASSGEHEVKISIDPDGSILQLGPGDGELSGPITKEVSVKGEGFFGRLESISPVISIIIGILLPIIIASAAVAIVNRKKQK
ncbi:MAG: CARDB domain-containing protein, partial [Candidatus Thermoplasmatota archaeon]|nr:CARDB domain-containing protein [Candidatus Thermoplasmatota archaeon]